MKTEKANKNFDNEINEIKERYTRRKQLPADLYNSLYPSVYMIKQEKERAFIRWITECGISPVESKKILEIGCGGGINLQQFINLGFTPANLVGNELLPERVENARENLPASVKIIEGNALDLNLPDESFDIVFQSMVFSSILDKSFQDELAKKMWRLVKPGGGILWYDFTFDNPKNKDVKGVTYSRVKQLFSTGKIKKYRVTLAPPLSRIVTTIHPVMYTFFNMFPFLRTHILCWISK